MQYARPCFGAMYGVCSQPLVVIVVMFIVVMLPPPPPPPGTWQLNITGVLHCQHRRDAGAMQYARPCFGAIYGVCSQPLVVIVVMFIVVMLSCLGDLPAAAVGSPVPKHCSWSNPWLEMSLELSPYSSP